VQLALDYLKNRYPQIAICTLNVKEYAILCEWMGEQTGVPVGKRLTAPAVFVGNEALVDGLNPCAFATIVFFISYLAFMGRRSREVLAVGAALALGVFLTYLGIGVGLLRFLAALPFPVGRSRG